MIARTVTRLIKDEWATKDGDQKECLQCFYQTSLCIFFPQKTKLFAKWSVKLLNETETKFGFKLQDPLFALNSIWKYYVWDFMVKSLGLSFDEISPALLNPAL